MTKARRLGSEASEVQVRFIDAAEALLSEGNGHAISSRLVAERAGLKMQLLYYYFRNMDDLLLALVHRVNERRTARFEEALSSPEPLRALWEQMIDPASATLAAEMLAIAKQREAVRAEMIKFGEEFRDRQTQALKMLLAPPPADGVQYTAAGIVMIGAALARMLVNETVLGFTKGHADALVIVEQLVRRLPRAGERPSFDQKRPPT